MRALARFHRKTTLINVLIGFLEPSRGTALIEGLDIRSKMNEIYHIMGVCPQVRHALCRLREAATALL